VTVEENVVQGGAGSAVGESLERLRLPHKLLQLGLPDRFIEHGDPASLVHECGSDAEGLLAAIRSHIAE
jgi:1-deoxy-D-xylulose-5-phosphate synthase